MAEAVEGEQCLGVKLNIVGFTFGGSSEEKKLRGFLRYATTKLRLREWATCCRYLPIPGYCNDQKSNKKTQDSHKVFFDEERVMDDIAQNTSRNLTPLSYQSNVERQY